jgi:hypothetical protein
VYEVVESGDGDVSESVLLKFFEIKNVTLVKVEKTQSEYNRYNIKRMPDRVYRKRNEYSAYDLNGCGHEVTQNLGSGVGHAYTAYFDDKRVPYVTESNHLAAIKYDWVKNDPAETLVFLDKLSVEMSFAVVPKLTYSYLLYIRDTSTGGGGRSGRQKRAAEAGGRSGRQKRAAEAGGRRSTGRAETRGA